MRNFVTRIQSVYTSINNLKVRNTLLPFLLVIIRINRKIILTLQKLSKLTFRYIFHFMVFVASFSIFFTTLSFWLETYDRRAQITFQAWDVLRSKDLGGAGSSARYALEYLNTTSDGALCINILGYISSHILGTENRNCLIPPREKPHFRGLDLVDVDLENAHLSGADLRGANLENANLTGANLTDADLTGSNLKNATLRGAILTNANLIAVRLKGADLSFTELSNANFDHARLGDVKIRQAIMTGASFIDVNIEGADFQENCGNLIYYGNETRPFDVIFEDCTDVAGMFGPSAIVPRYKPSH